MDSELRDVRNKMDKYRRILELEETNYWLNQQVKILNKENEVLREQCNLFLYKLNRNRYDSQGV